MILLEMELTSIKSISSKYECRMAILGVPLGLVLGELLFLIHSNDIESQIISSIRHKLQKCANTRQMEFNVNKCTLLRITYRKSSVIKYMYNVY